MTKTRNAAQERRQNAGRSANLGRCMVVNSFRETELEPAAPVTATAAEGPSIFMVAMAGRVRHPLACHPATATRRSVFRWPEARAVPARGGMGYNAHVCSLRLGPTAGLADLSTPGLDPSVIHCGAADRPAGEPATSEDS